MSILEISHVGATAVLTLNRPEQRNALDEALREALGAAVAQVRDDPTVRAVVITGAGGHFSAGGDVKTLAGVQSGKRDIFEGRERMRKIHRWLDQLIDLEKPVIAAVDGVAYGAGLSLALCADFVLASPRATFCSVFSRIGYVPDMGAMYLLPRVVGLVRAKELVFSARVVSAAEAQTLGIVMAVAQEQEVLQAALVLAARFHDAPTEVLGLAKSVMNRTFESSRHDVYAQEAMAQTICREGEFHAEAVRRFVAKEAPRYQWKQDKP